MQMNLGKFVHTESGKMIMSVLLGFGLASLFRKVCKEYNCLDFRAPPLADFKDKIYKIDDKCVKYVPVASKCSLNAKIVRFE
jgi:hypothetical protein